MRFLIIITLVGTALSAHLGDSHSHEDGNAYNGAVVHTGIISGKHSSGQRYDDGNFKGGFDDSHESFSSGKSFLGGKSFNFGDSDEDFSGGKSHFGGDSFQRVSYGSGGYNGGSRGFSGGNKGRFFSSGRGISGGARGGFRGPAEISRNVYVYESPKNTVLYGPAPIIPKGKIHHNVLFVKTPQIVGNNDPIVVPQTQTKTVLYVLSKNGQQPQRLVEISDGPQIAPEVYYVHYNDGENPVLPDGRDLKSALSEANNGYGKLSGGYGDIHDGGFSSIHVGGHDSDSHSGEYDDGHNFGRNDFSAGKFEIHGGSVGIHGGGYDGSLEIHGGNSDESSGYGGDSHKFRGNNIKIVAGIGGHYSKGSNNKY